MPDFEDFGALKLLAQRIKLDVDTYSIWKYSQEDVRLHLGASEIGDECWRKIYLKFRWAKKEQFSGRMLRLFRRGHNEEEKFIDLLQGIGMHVWPLDPETGKQWRVLGVKGHSGGSSDGFGMLPDRYAFPATPMLLEFKTHNTKSFAKLLKEGVVISKAQHWAQMCNYGFKRNVHYALYCAVNKDDDDLHFEVVKLDMLLGADTERKAEELIFAKTPPRRIGESPAFWKCKGCVFTGICYDGERPEKNCRSCMYSVPTDNGEWNCNRFMQPIPADFIIKGCDVWSPVINA